MKSTPIERETHERNSRALQGPAPNLGFTPLRMESQKLPLKLHLFSSLKPSFTGINNNSIIISNSKDSNFIKNCYHSYQSLKTERLVYKLAASFKIADF